MSKSKLMKVTIVVMALSVTGLFLFSQRPLEVRQEWIQLQAEDYEFLGWFRLLIHTIGLFFGCYHIVGHGDEHNGTGGNSVDYIFRTVIENGVGRAQLDPVGNPGFDVSFDFSLLAFGRCHHNFLAWQDHLALTR